jgi:hypothetical protein
MPTNHARRRRHSVSSLREDNARHASAHALRYAVPDSNRRLWCARRPIVDRDVYDSSQTRYNSEVLILYTWLDGHLVVSP